VKRVAIVGVGLIGSSFALALRKAGFDGEVIGVSSARSIEAGIRSGAIARGAPIDEAAESADLIYLAQPIDQILNTLPRLGRIAPAECLITDAGSTKRQIITTAAEHVRHATFIGGHPMAGKESRGAESADADLFRNRPYVLAKDLVPKIHADAHLRTLREWLARIGAVVYEMSAAEHDRTVALTSHLPQLLSTALAATLAKQQTSAVSRIFGPGLMDMTRLAMSAPEVWMSVLGTNRDAVLEAIGTYMETLSTLRANLESGEINEIFGTASQFAHSLRK
jgi:prephenate dehydrogenase